MLLKLIFTLNISDHASERAEMLNRCFYLFIQFYFTLNVVTQFSKTIILIYCEFEIIVIQMFRFSGIMARCHC